MSAGQQGRTCDKCMYWEEFGATSDIGECHRHAPHPILRGPSMELNHDLSYPITSMVHWCGEFEKREPE